MDEISHENFGNSNRFLRRTVMEASVMKRMQTICKLAFRLPGVLRVFAAVLLLTFCVGVVVAVDEPPVGVWLFDKDDKGTATDSSGNDHDGEIQGGVEWTADGRFGGALEFGGLDGWVEVPNHKDLQFPQGTDFTLAAWLKVTTPEGTPPMIVAKNYYPAQVLPWYALYYADQAKAATGDVSLFLRDNAGTSFHIAAGTKIDDEEWHHVVGTREGDKLTLYVDTEVKAELGGADFDVGTNDAPMHFMSHLDRYLGGLLDEVVIYKHALSPDEILTLSEEGFEKFQAVSPEGKATMTWAAIKQAE